MKRLAIIIIFLFFTGLSGCVSHPQTAEGFRQALIKGAFMTKVETFEVNRPFSEVADTFQKMAAKCLNKTIKTTSSTRQSYQVIVTTYIPGWYCLLWSRHQPDPAFENRQ